MTGADTVPETVRAAETTLAGIVAKVLGIEKIGPDDDFFRLGGNSLQLMQSVGLARRAGYELDLDRAFEQPTIAGLARVVTGEQAPGGQSRGLREVRFGPPQSGRTVHVILTSGQDLPEVGTLGEKPALAQTSIDVLMPLWHRAEPYVDMAGLSRRFFDYMVQTPPEDGFHLVGHCAAGPLAARIACQLQEHGHPVRQVILLDAAVPGPEARSSRLEDYMPMDPAAPHRLAELRGELARIGRLRSEEALVPPEVLRRAWKVVSRNVVELLTLELGTDVTDWSPADREAAATNYMAWFNLLIGMEEPLTRKLLDGTPLVLFLSQAQDSADAIARYAQRWRDCLGGSVEMFHEPGRHRGLLYNDRLVSVLEGDRGASLQPTPTDHCGASHGESRYVFNGGEAC